MIKVTHNNKVLCIFFYIDFFAYRNAKLFKNCNFNFFSQELIQSPREISARILQEAREIAEDHFRSCWDIDSVSITRAVITYPAYFQMPQKEETREAAKLAGFTDVKLICEPAAGDLLFILNGWI